MKDPKLQGTHKKAPGDGGYNCGGHVCGGSCGQCGADFIAPKNIRKAAQRPSKSAKQTKKR